MKILPGVSVEIVLLPLRTILTEVEGNEQRNGVDVSDGGILGRATMAIKSGLNTVGQSIWGESPPKESPLSPPWELPEVTHSEVEDVLRDMQRVGQNVTIGQRRKGSGVTSPPKRVRRRSNVHLMSGAL